VAQYLTFWPLETYVLPHGLAPANARRIAAVRSRRAESNLKHAADRTGSFTGVGVTSEEKNRDSKRSYPRRDGYSF